ncbi:helix-turn-helix domain-containing protein [Actinomadura latina]|uniref:Helix-turn-helix transcriptional regulator n=1 Tax=Actinomadura latina TaxID=163603 RepID=A0A846Z7W7_9ACTN|nr:AraC family transcriptional regulator [Actinomadura latina]NKZ06493.1 helix-turn-helix transcriptional regulator [Actinomadura latina]
MLVRHFDFPAAKWEAALSWPHPRLRAEVHAYLGFRLGTGSALPWQEIPGGAVTLLIGLDQRHPVWCSGLDDATTRTPYTSFVSGLSTRSSWVVEPADGAHCVAVVMAPWAAFAIFGTAMNELTGKIVDPADLPGDRVRRLAGALAARPDWEQRFRLLDEVLGEWIGGADAWSTRVVRAHGALIRTVGAGGSIPVQRLAAEAGWRPRQLEYRFIEQIGVSPKAMARIVRFRRAALMLADGLRPANTSTNCGFSDQAHLTREFKAMAGFTPNRFRQKAELAAAGSPIYTASYAAARRTKTLMLPAA